jgi:exopolyphosphatase/pppGpp-phosphohydrolase
MKMKHYLTAILALVSASLYAENQVRAAIDFGSGGIKIMEAEIDPDAGRIVGQPLLNTWTKLKLTEDVAAHNGLISPEMEAKAISILRGFQEAAYAAFPGGQPQFAGIATAVFRKAHNGQEVLQHIRDELGMELKVLSQDDEGRVGFVTAQAVYPEVAPEHLIAYDSGSSSFQLTVQTAQGYQVYQGPLAHGNVRIMLSQEIRGGHVLTQEESGNPISAEEIRQLRSMIRDGLPPAPDWLRERLNDDRKVVAGFGDQLSIFAIVAKAAQGIPWQLDLEGATVTIQDVDDVLTRYVGCDDATLAAAGVHPKTITCAVLLGQVMETFGMDAVEYRPSNGSTPGILILPEFWPSE